MATNASKYPRATRQQVAAGQTESISLLKNALVAFFNLAESGAKLLSAGKITTCVAIFSIASVRWRSQLNTSTGY
jgi:hypothetical protein